MFSSSGFFIGTANKMKFLGLLVLCAAATITAAAAPAKSDEELADCESNYQFKFI